MTEDFALQSLRYLLDQMAPSERRDFNTLLDSDSAACALFRSYADALAAHAAEQAMDVKALSNSDADRILGSLQYEVLPSLASTKSASSGLRTWIWPAAALLLLALNLWQFFKHEAAPERGPTVLNGESSALKSEGQAPSPHKAIGYAGEPNQIRSSGQSYSAEQVQAERNQLNEDCELLREERDRLAGEAQRLARSLRTLTLANASGTKLSAMEMVDPSNYANGQRRGLFDSARKLLVSQGSVTPPSPPPTNSGTENLSSTVSTGSSTALVNTNGSTVAAATPSATVNVGTSGTTNDTSANGTTPANTQPPTDSSTTSDSPNLLLGTVNATSTSDTSSSVLPYAWTIFDASSNQGSINLYNLPNVSSNETLVLWTKADAPGASYVRIGSIPETLAGKSGNILFRTPDNSIPTEILISRESKSTPASVPKGTIVLHGP